MKVNRTRSIAKNNMRRSGQTKNRPEQLLAAALIQAHLPLNASVETEETLYVFNPDKPDFRNEVSVDITVRLPGAKVAIEVNGPPHDELPQIRRDNRKKLILEWKGNDWKYLVFDYKYMVTLFLRNKRELDYDEVVKAYGEILVTVGDVLPLHDANKQAIEAVLRRTQI